MTARVIALVVLLGLTTSSFASAQSPPDSAFLDVHGVRLHYLTWGGTGAPLILVPARCDSPFVFGELAPLLTGSYSVYSVTARGCGSSGQAGDGYSLDVQVRELVGFLDALGIERAAFAGHSASGGKVLRLARAFPSRVTSIVALDIIYAGVPDKFEAGMQEAIDAAAPAAEGLMERHRREFRAWELGTWSPSLERDLLEQTELGADGRRRFHPAADGWMRAFVSDVKAGLYHEQATTHPTLFIVADDLDLNRVKQLPPKHRATLEPMAREIQRARRVQLDGYRRSGARVQVIALPGASHYLFVDRSRDVAKHMVTFLAQARR